MAKDGIPGWLIGVVVVAGVAGGLLLWRRRAEASEAPPEDEAEHQEIDPMEPTPETPAPATPAPLPDLPGPLRRFRLTEYWVAPLEWGDVEIFDKAGASLGKITAASKKNLDLEGSGRLPDGRVLAHTGRSGTYKVLPPGVLATGTGGRTLTPWRSVAADQGSYGGKQPWKDDVTRGGPLLKAGDRLWVQELNGVKLPDGTTHDGWVTVEDTGGAIYGVHLDLFVGEKSGRLKHPTIVNVSGPGFDQIPESYEYGLKKVDQYKDLRPPALAAAK